jgi:hypothetical protein
MQTVERYKNIHEELPKLQEVLLHSIQSDILEIKKIDKGCDKFSKVMVHKPALQDAEYVIFSKYVKKSEHRFEKFVFVDAEGKMLGHISGQEIELYGMIGACLNLALSEEYQMVHEVKETANN